jgi:hypothetical protein
MRISTLLTIQWVTLTILTVWAYVLDPVTNDNLEANLLFSKVMLLIMGINFLAMCKFIKDNDD